MLPVINAECVRQAVRTGLGLKAQDQSASRCSTARIISIPTCRRATRSASTSSRSSARARSIVDLADGEAVTIGIERLHLEQDAGKSLHDQHANMQLRRSQPLRRGADGDRVEAGPALGRGGQGLSHQAALDPALSRHLRRRHGEGLPARRRQRLGAQAGRAARHALRDQEHELDPLHRRRDRATKRAGRSRSSRTAARSSRRRGCSIRTRARRARCAPRKRRTTTAISPIPTCCRWNSTQPKWRRSKAQLPELPDEKKARFMRDFGAVGL